MVEGAGIPPPMRKTILIVDDSEFIRGALVTALEADDDTDVIVAKSGREALFLLEHPNDISAVVVDVSMPILGGKELLQQLDHVPGEGPFIVAIGTRNERPALEECLLLGAHRFLTKPLDTGVLRGILRAALHGEHRTASARQ